MHIGWSDEISRGEVIVLRGILHHIVPDWPGSSDTDNIVHLRVVAVSGPHSYCKIGSITHRPVVTETIRSACFRRDWTICQFKWVARPELVIARGFVGENAAHEKCHICSHSANTMRVCRIILIEWVPLAVGDL